MPYLVAYRCYSIVHKKEQTRTYDPSRSGRMINDQIVRPVWLTLKANKGDLQYDMMLCYSPYIGALSRYQHNELTDRISNDTPHRTVSNSNYVRYYLDNHTLSFDVSTG